jgi:hypothetical protein
VDQRPPLSSLTSWIYQFMNSWVPKGQQRQLAMGYTEHLAGGDIRKHPSPDALWEQEPLYPQYVEERAQYWRSRSGTPAQRRAKLINQLGAYRGNPYAWLEWRERHVGAMIPEEEMTGSRMEAV